eukprot:TRINITY_DN14853_c0_g1_i1.p1 TRINITY_DN14853_c0_g1~~TRINITY_DN14853_c0_g1_i1.p1  ORF type:complete len:242 (-),score=29.18 TRINITY_DN14853_c0_g1_i1:519-1244(-)
MHYGQRRLFTLAHLFRWLFFFLRIRRPPRSTLSSSSAASDVYKRQGIIEPGELMEINDMMFKNNGQMWTPPVQPIIVYLQNTEWVNFDMKQDSVPITESIKANQMTTLPESLRFRIKDSNEVAVDSIFIKTAIIDYRAFVSRVNQEFKDVAAAFDQLEVRYPVECSPILGINSITQQGEAPFAFKLSNLSTQSIGMLADDINKRLLKISFLVYSELDTNKYPIELNQKGLSESSDECLPFD